MSTQNRVSELEDDRFVCVFILKFIYFIYFERERERERENEPPAGSALSTQSPAQGSNPRTMKS